MKPLMPFALSLLAIAASSFAAEPETGTSTAAANAAPAWVAIANQKAGPVLDFMAKHSAEGASMFGVDKYDTEVSDLRPQLYERTQAEAATLLKQLDAQMASEKESHVKQDLQILRKAVADNKHSMTLQHDLMLPYFSVSQLTFSGLQQLLDPRNSPERQKLALIRLQRYAGLEKGYTAMTELAKARTSERLQIGKLTFPYVEEVSQDIANTEQYIAGIEAMFRAAKLDGWQAAHAALSKQLREYQAWEEKTILPRARKSNLLPGAIYADNLKQMGVDMEAEELMQRAQFGFSEIRDEMQVLANRIAKERAYTSSDYRDVIHELKKLQVPADQVLPMYEAKLAALESIIEKEQLLTLPQRKANIRLASEAESAQIPAPHMNPPRLIGNTGEYGEFVLPLINPNAKAGGKMDDYTHEAGMWTLTAHEARPGHELQFAAMVENGVSIPRAVFAFNSANAEGWGLYAEAIAKQYMPLEGQFFSLEKRLMRAARAFLDPMVNLGKLTPDEAQAFLMKEVGLSEAAAKQEADRYAFNAPGQATSYYYGYMKLRETRVRTEMALGAKFVQKDFHDFVLKQGLLPPDLLAKAVQEEFVTPQLKNSTLANN